VTESTSETETPVVPRNAVDALLVEHLGRLNRIHEDDLKVKRRETMWRNIRTVGWMFIALLSVGVTLLSSMFLYGMQHDGPPTEDYVAMVRIDGVIDAQQMTSARRVTPALVRAFRDQRAKGIVIVINSPGGGATQSQLIALRLKALREEYPDKKVVVVGEDMLTSGAYMIAVEAEQIFVAPSTYTGSIGVVMSGFGLSGAIQRFGVERRVYTAGEHKVRADPFLPERKDDRTKLDELLKVTHKQFIDMVVTARGDRLKGDPKMLFSGDFWTGDRAVSLGLVDGISDLPSVLEDVFGVSYTRDFTPKADIFEQFSNRVPKMLAGAMGEGLGLSYGPMLLPY